jgi:hypothetical protein
LRFHYGVPQEIRDLIRTMSRNNSIWGAPRIHGEWLKVGIEITDPAVAKYTARWRTTAAAFSISVLRRNRPQDGRRSNCATITSAEPPDPIT